MSIRRGSIPFIKVAQVGELDSKGKVVLGIGHKGRIEGRGKSPLSRLVISVIEMILPHVGHASDEAAIADLDLLKQYVNGLEITPPDDVA